MWRYQYTRTIMIQNFGPCHPEGTFNQLQWSGYCGLRPQHRDTTTELTYNLYRDIAI